MTDNEELKHLQERAQALDTQIKDIDDEIERCVLGLGQGDDPARVISFLRDRFNAQLGYMYDLGKVEARAEDLENRLHELENLDREEGITSTHFKRLPLAREDYLDWLRPDLEEPAHDEQHQEPQHDRRLEGEELLLDEMHREDREPEEYPEWRNR